MKAARRRLAYAGAAALSLLCLGALGVFLKINILDTNNDSAPYVAVSLHTLPDNIAFEGEAATGGVLQTLDQRTDADAVHLLARGRPDALSLRLSDAQGRYYDIDIGHAVRLSGLSPQTRVSLSVQEAVLYRDVPADWNGRITLDAPRDKPITLSFAQNGQPYALDIFERGGAL